MEFKVYLAGPIGGHTFAGATNWRNYVKRKMPKEIFTMSPMRGKQREELTKDEIIKTTFEGNPLTSGKGIMMRDYNDVKRADLVLVNLTESPKPSFGTVMEIAWAYSLKIPIILVMEKDNLHQHEMIKNACGMIVEDLDKAIELANTVLLPDRILEKHQEYIRLTQSK